MSHPNHCCPSNGAAWDTPVPGSTVLVPPGTQVIATPGAYGGCGCSSPVASSVTGGATATTPAALSVYPTLKNGVEVPAINSNFQIVSTGASQWALAGMRVWFPPFGYAEITGVTGDLVTLKNLDITLGTVLGAGSPLLAFPPPIPVTIVQPTLKPFRPSRPRPKLYEQIKLSGAAWVPETVNRDISVYNGYDATYGVAVLSIDLGGYSGTRSFDIFVNINGLRYSTIKLGNAGSSDGDGNGCVLVPITPSAKVIEIATGEFTNASGTYASCYCSVYLEGFLH